MSGKTNKQATWKTFLIIGIVAAVVWVFVTIDGTPDNVFDQILRNGSGAFALVGLLAGGIMFIQSRKD